MTEIFRLCADYLDQFAELDPVQASVLGIGGGYGPATDYSPDGYAARAELIRATLAALGRLPVTSEADRRAAAHLRERLQAEQAWHASGEPLLLRAPVGVVTLLRDSVELLPRGDDEQWRGVAARLAAVPGMLASWRTSLDAGRQRGLTAARRPLAMLRPHATCAPTMHLGHPRQTLSAPSATPWLPGCTWAPTSILWKPTSGAGRSCTAPISTLPRRSGSSR